jgi:F-type H+-transporting ATPase subunit delta
MRGSSAESYRRLLDALPAASEQLGDELIAAAGVLRAQTALRRAATDTASPTQVRTQLLAGVFGPHLSADACAVVVNSGDLRWARGADLPQALERLGIVALVRAADAAGQGDRIDDELFAFERAVATSTQLRDALADESRSVADRQRLIDLLLDGKAAPITVRLAREALAGDRAHVVAAIDELIEIAAEARNRKVATIRTAYPISSAQQDRLRATLGRDAGSEVHLNVIVDPTLVGGLLVEIGDDVIDGTVGTRLDNVRRRIAG